MRSLILVLMVMLFSSAAESAPAKSPGAIQQLESPAGMAYQYDAETDRSVMTDPGKTQIIVSVLPPFEPRATLAEILDTYDAAHLAASIEMDSIAGRTAATVSARQQSDNWWLVFRVEDLNLFVQVEDARDARANRERVERIAETVRLAPATYPQSVIGDYSTGTAYSGDVQSSVGVYSESGIRLGADGSITSSGHVSITSEAVAGYSAGSEQDGWWQVRGNRMLAFYPPSTFYNYLFKAFSNGLEIYPPQDDTLLWPRK